MTGCGWNDGVWLGGWRPAVLVAIGTQENHGKRLIMARDAAAPGRIAVRQPWLMEWAAAHLAGRTMGAVELFVADDAENGTGYLECCCHFTTSTENWQVMSLMVIISMARWRRQADCATHCRARASSSSRVWVSPSSRALRKARKASPTAGPAGTPNSSRSVPRMRGAIDHHSLR